MLAAWSIIVLLILCVNRQCGYSFCSPFTLFFMIIVINIWWDLCLVPRLLWQINTHSIWSTTGFSLVNDNLNFGFGTVVVAHLFKKTIFYGFFSLCMCSLEESWLSCKILLIICSCTNSINSFRRRIIHYLGFYSLKGFPIKIFVFLLLLLIRCYLLYYCYNLRFTFLEVC